MDEREMIHDVGGERKGRGRKKKVTGMNEWDEVRLERKTSSFIAYFLSILLYSIGL